MDLVLYRHPSDVFQTQFGANDFEITRRVHIALHVFDVLVHERAHHVENRIHSLTKVGKQLKLISNGQ
jgi:hypothetical protein